MRVLNDKEMQAVSGGFFGFFGGCFSFVTSAVSGLLGACNIFGHGGSTTPPKTDGSGGK